MNFNLVINLFVSLFSTNAQKIKFCINCKYYKKEFLSSNKFGSCLLHPIVKENNYFLVDGSKNNLPTDYHYCSVARKNLDMCGPDGKQYEKK